MWDGSSLTKGKPNPLAFARTVVTTKTAAQRSSRVPDASAPATTRPATRSEEHTSELQSQSNLVCRLLLEKKKYNVLFTVSLAPTVHNSPPLASAQRFARP